MDNIASAKSSQNVTLPDIPEFFDKKFLDALVPPHIDAEYHIVADPSSGAEAPKNPMIDALKETTNQVRTANFAPALASTLNATLDAFNSLNAKTSGQDFNRLLAAAWKEDPALALRVIWSLRSIPDGKGNREVFYKAFGWLYEHHPRTAIGNLHLLVDAVVRNPKSEVAAAHGYWKDLPNILAMATLDELTPEVASSSFLNPPRTPATPKRGKQKKERAVRPAGQPSKLAEHNDRNAQRKKEAQGKRAEAFTSSHAKLIQKLSDPKYRALYVGITRLFGDRIIRDLAILDHVKSLSPDEDRLSILKTLSLAGKWAPTPACTHDRVTNLSSAIALYIYTAKPPSLQFPTALLQSQSDARATFVLLRRFLGASVLKPLREASGCPEPRMAGNEWTSIKYARVPSTAMKNNTEHFFKHDPSGFQKYLIDVESGKKNISGATLFPHELVSKILEHTKALKQGGAKAPGKYPEVDAFKKQLAETQLRVTEAQWKALVANLKASGTLENSIAICDVSGSMGSIYGSCSAKSPEPIFVSVALSLILASLSSPPFDAGFISFSASPKFISLDFKGKSLADNISDMVRSDWSMNTDLNAVFLKLLLPLAKKHKVKQADMIKRLFIFSDMQFDQADDQGRSADKWETNYDVIERAYKAAGYEVPQIVFWDLNASGRKTVEVTANRKGVAMMNGFSPALLKVFMGEAEAGVGEEWQDVEGGGVVVVEEEFNPVNVMRKALLKEGYEGLRVLD